MMTETPAPWAHLFQPTNEIDPRFIGASEFASLIGADPWKDAWGPYGRLVNGVVEDHDKPWLRWGHILEPVIARQWIEEHDGGRYSRWVRGSSWFFEERFRVSVDYQAPESGEILEIKNQRFGWTDGIPHHYRIQAQVQMHAMDMDRVHFGVLFGGSDLQTFTEHRDFELGPMLWTMAQNFWERHIATGVPPDVTGSDACKRALLKKFGDPSKATREVTGADAELVAEYVKVKAEAKALETTIASLANRILGLIGDDYGVTCGASGVIAPKVRGRLNTQWAAVEKELASYIDRPALDAIKAKHSRRSDDHRALKIQGQKDNGEEA